jgi:hypothetical protein
MKKANLVFLLFLVMSLFSQENWYQSIKAGTYINRESQLLKIPEGYQVSSEFSNGLAYIFNFRNREYPYALINENAEIILELANGFSYSLPKDGLIKARNRDARTVGYLNLDGEWIIEPTFEGGSSFTNGKALVRLNGEQVVINQSGQVLFSIKEVIGNRPFDYAAINITDEVLRVFKATTVSSILDTQQALISADGTLLKDFVPGEYSEFSEGYATHQAERFAPYTIVDRRGDTASQFPPANYYSPFKEGLALIREDKKMGYINKSGDIVIPLQFSYATPFVDGYAAFTYFEPRAQKTELLTDTVEGTSRGIYGFINRSGEVVIEPIYAGLPTLYPGGVARVDAFTEDGESTLTTYIDLTNAGRIIEQSDQPWRITREYVSSP